MKISTKKSNLLIKLVFECYVEYAFDLLMRFYGKSSKDCTKMIQLHHSMLILISCLSFFISALVLVVLRIFQPEARYTWLVAVSGATVGLLSVFFWLGYLPFELSVQNWQSFTSNSLLFTGDAISFPFALCIAALTLSILLTAVTQPVYINTTLWAGVLALAGVGILAVTANNPLTLLLVWALLDLTELIIHLSSVSGAKNNEKVVISFSTRAFGIGLLLWASLVGVTETNNFIFESISARSGLILVLAVGLRLGVLPLHLPYATDLNLRRGIGTALRLISSASSLILLGRIPTGILDINTSIFLITLTLIAAGYGSWMWFRSPDDLTGRPYWIISIASLAIISTLSGNPQGAITWGCALILVGGALFLTTVQNNWLNRAMLFGAWSISTFPFSLTASAWLGNLGLFLPFVIIAQAFTAAGFIRHTLRPSGRDTLDAQLGWMKVAYAAGIILLIFIQILLGLIGWEGTMQIRTWLQALSASLLTLGLVWARRRFRIFNPVRAHGVSANNARLESFYNILWSLYHLLSRISKGVTQILEGEGGLMWSLLFLILFISIIST